MKKYSAIFICLIVFVLTNCYLAKAPYAFKGDTLNSFYVVDTLFDTALSKATETAIEMGWKIGETDHEGGTFSAATVGTMFDGSVTTMSFIITKEADGRLKCTISLKSSRGNQTVIDEFKSSCGKKVKISES